MSDCAHTTLPWKGTDSGTGIFSAGEPLGKNKIIAICTTDAVSRARHENKANADFILRACNNHYELLRALERAFEILDGIADKLFFGDGQPVTALDAGQIEEIYFEALSEHVAFETLIRQVRGEI